MLDYQFLGLVAVVMAIITRGSLLPVVAVTAFIGLVTLACEAATRWYRRHHPKAPVRLGRVTPVASSGQMNRWMAAVERILGSPD
jgi:hypothetical protein